MLYLFAGDDSGKKLGEYQKFLRSLSGNPETFFVNRNNFDARELESFYSGMGLFFSKSAVVLEGLLDREETRSFILSKLHHMSESGNTFIVLEGNLPKTVLDAFKKSKAKINNFLLQKEKKEKYNNFLLANALGSREKLKMWIYFREAVTLGVGLEELVGVLFWKAKDMVLKRNFSKFSEQELKNFTARISYLLPQARRAGRDAEAAFEKFLLEAL